MTWYGGRVCGYIRQADGKRGNSPPSFAIPVVTNCLIFFFGILRCASALHDLSPNLVNTISQPPLGCRYFTNTQEHHVQEGGMRFVQQDDLVGLW